MSNPPKQYLRYIHRVKPDTPPEEEGESEGATEGKSQVRTAFENVHRVCWLEL